MSNSKNKKIEFSKSYILTVFSVLLGFAAVASTAAFILIRFGISKAYQKKWRDYEDCGVS